LTAKCLELQKLSVIEISSKHFFYFRSTQFQMVAVLVTSFSGIACAENMATFCNCETATVYENKRKNMCGRTCGILCMAFAMTGASGSA